MSKYARPNVQNMQGYSWGEQPLDTETIKLNTNENPYPPSPAVDAALANLGAAALRVYPQPTADGLRDKLAKLHGCARNNIVVTNGGDEALRLALTTFVNPGGHFGMAEPSYSLYPVLAAIHDAQVVRVELEADWQLPESCADIWNRASVELACLVNPHAPSGTLTDAEDLRRVAAAMNGVLLIDEAYVNFVDPQRAYDATPLIEQDNVLILRTFSKGYGLAGLRLGYLLGHADLITTIIDKTRDSYNIDHISQVLGTAAIGDQAYARETWAQVRDARRLLAAQLGQLGLFSVPSETNFLLVDVIEQPVTAERLFQRLKGAGILVRHFSAPRLQDKLRVTVGTPAENHRLIATLTDLLA
ncbi:MAG: histidinol-phosphate transaminase [Pseudomonadota bacterium]